MADTTILIDDPEVVRDIEQLAKRRGKPVEAAVADAVRAQLVGTPRLEKSADQRDAELREILARIDALPHDGQPLTDDDLYDEHGLPR